ncbi:hypothetical protein Fmac_011368 [Flemingia macrophylla]|uniref:GATA-type domain-containing protein n=1 Tax=Flemingia macrophylla TaxID=520843 RepID=A0ABD1MMA3_9FABA
MNSPNYEDSNSLYDKMECQICNFGTSLCSTEDEDEFLEYPLCVPEDPLESLEGINFWEDVDFMISIQDFIISNPLYNNKEKMEQIEEKDVDSSKLKLLPSLELQNRSNSTKRRTKILKVKKSSAECENNFENSAVKKCGMKKRRHSKRRCSHCNVKDTPQWRAGPLGRNTLCNACGIRYKSGKLLAEYRPARNPSFDVNKYSNIHKKIPGMKS